MAQHWLGRYNSWLILGALGFSILKPGSVYAQPSTFPDEPRNLQVVERSLGMPHGESLAGFLALPESTLELEMWRAREGDDSARRWFLQTASRAATLPDSERKVVGVGSVSEQAGVLMRYAIAAQVSRESGLQETARALANEVGRGEKISEHSGLEPKDAAGMVKALSELYAATLDASVLVMAENLAEWLWGRSTSDPSDVKKVEVQRALVSSEVARACLSLYEVTAERKWLTRASQAFGRAQDVRPHLASLDNISILDIARTSARLFRYTGDSHADEIARWGVATIGQKRVVRPSDVATLLLAKRELAIEPAHVTVVGGKQDERARTLWRESLTAPSLYSRREWLDRAEGPLPRNDATFPVLSSPAAYVCVQKRCSLPLFTEEELRAKLNQAFPPL